MLLLADEDFVAGLDALDTANIDDVVTLGRIHGQAGTGHSEHVECLRGELGAGRNLDVGESRDVGRMETDGPTGEVDVPVGGIVQFDEAVRDAELVDLHGLRRADLEAGALTAGGAGPVGHGLQVAVEGRGAGLNVEHHDGRLARFNGIRGRPSLLAVHGRLPALGHVQRNGQALDGLVRCIGETDHYLGGTAREEGLDVGGTVVVHRRENLEGGHAVAGRDHIGLDRLVELLRREGAGRGHRALIEGARGAVAVVASVAQQDGALLAHRVVTVALVADAAAVVIHLQAALLGVSAHGAPMVRLTVRHRRDEAPGDGVEALAELVVRVVVDTAHEIVLLVGHDPRARGLAVVPDGLVAEIGRFHGAVAVVAAVGLGVAVVEAAAGVVVVAADHPVLALGLVVHGRAGGVVETHAHARGDEQAVDLVAQDVDRGPISDGNVVVAAHRGTAEATARGLVQVVPLAGLVIEDRDPAVGVLAEGVLRIGVGIAARVVRRGRDDADVQRLSVRGAHHLVQRPVVGGVQGARCAVRRHARGATTLINIARALGTRERRPIVRQILACDRRTDKDKHDDGTKENLFHIDRMNGFSAIKIRIHLIGWVSGGGRQWNSPAT